MDGIIAYILSKTNGSGNTNYNNLTNKPSINGVTLEGLLTSANLNMYTRNEVDQIVETAADGRFIVVNTLPTTNIKTNVIYLVPSAIPANENTKDEYINLDGTTSGWEYLGNTQIDLSDYVKKEDVYTKAQADAAFVEKIAGKGLSTNDYTDAEKAKVATAETVNAAQDALLVDNAGKNLLRNNASSTAYNGITFTVNDDKSVGVSGTATARANLFLISSAETPLALDAGDYVYSLPPSHKQAAR